MIPKMTPQDNICLFDMSCMELIYELLDMSDMIYISSNGKKVIS